jgi:hypothetical protein
MSTFPLKIYVSSGIATDALSKPGILNTVSFKRGNIIDVNLWFVKQTTIGSNTVNETFLLESGSPFKIELALKVKDKYKSTTKYSAYGYTSTVPAFATDPYVIPLDLSVFDDDEFEVVSGSGQNLVVTEKPYIDLMMEITWTIGERVESLKNPITATVYNQIVREDLSDLWPSRYGDA